jgi:hypothetical protein
MCTARRPAQHQQQGMCGRACPTAAAAVAAEVRVQGWAQRLRP